MKGLRFRAVRPAEIPLAAQQSLEAFGGSPDRQVAVEERFRAALDDGELWGVDADGVLVGHCRLLAVEHFFGGRPVRSLDIAGVAVAANHRRRGVATALLEAAAAWGTHHGLAMSLLYPGVPWLYRRLGWEMAGTFPRYKVPASLVAPRAETMRSAREEDWPAVVACHTRFAARWNGPAVRRRAQWEHLRAGPAQWVLDGAEGVDAYALTYRNAEPGEPAGAAVSVDWAATTPRGLRAVVALLASEAVDTAATLHAPAAQSWAPWADTWNLPDAGGLLWMARPLVWSAAIAARGFPAALSGAVTLAVDDRLIAEVRGPWRLEVEGGRGVLEPARSADVLMDVRAIGPLFTGFATPEQLAMTGLLDGPAGSLEVLGAMFAGPAPIALDFF